MNFRDSLLQRGVTEQQTIYATQGFLELLSGQVALAAEDAELAISLFNEGRTKELNALLRTLGRKLATAVFSHKTASLLMGRDGDDNRIEAL